MGFGVLTACGAASQADDPAATSDLQLEGVACTEVIEASKEHRELSTTFGGGVEGREAHLAIVELIEARPDGFDEDSGEFAIGMREMLPSSDAEREAIEDAESRCADGVGGGGVTATPTLYRTRPPPRMR